MKMVNHCEKIDYTFGSSYVIVDSRNQVVASCKSTDREKYKEMVRRYKPINAAVDTPLYLVG